MLFTDRLDRHHFHPSLVCRLNGSQDESCDRRMPETPGARRFQPSDLRFDAVGFDVRMHAARMHHGLHVDVQMIAGIDEFDTFPGLVRRQLPNIHPGRATPEVCRSLLSSVWQSMMKPANLLLCTSGALQVRIAPSPGTDLNPSLPL
ncbi:hypothetical protein [Solimonas terrae]|uniref:hypothetical protein n=1 Tax=Solimonas terrae TaxID=1396819 RepID=UPI001F504724|nr:hypothetical protein [Solimonas terrae]